MKYIYLIYLFTFFLSHLSHLTPRHPLFLHPHPLFFQITRRAKTPIRSIYPTRSFLTISPSTFTLDIVTSSYFLEFPWK